MAGHVTLMVSDRIFHDIPKRNLIRSSSYFRGLWSGNFKDSSETLYAFPDWSGTVFELVLNYMLKECVVLKGQNLKEIKDAIGLSEYLLVDGFKSELARELIISWTKLKMEDAMWLAEELQVSKLLEEYSLLRVLSAVEKEEQSGFPDQINYDLLISVTEMESFWTFHRKEVENSKHRWEEVLSQRCFDVRYKESHFGDIFQRYLDVVGLAIKLHPVTWKIRALARNMRLHILDDRSWISLTEKMGPTESVFRSTFEVEKVMARQKLENVVSRIRTSFVECKGPKEQILRFAEFDVSKWCWEVFQFPSELEECTHSFVTKNGAVFLGKLGVVKVDIEKHVGSSRFIQNKRLGEMLVSYDMEEQSCHGDEKYAYFIKQLDTFEVFSEIYKFDISRQKLTPCPEVPIFDMKLKFFGKKIYIVGHVEDFSFRVFEFKVQTNQILFLASSRDMGFSIKDFLITETKVYIFGRSLYAILDISMNTSQPMHGRPYVGFGIDLRLVNILSSYYTLGGIILLILVKTGHNEMTENEEAMMVARLDPKSSELECLGFLPKADGMDFVKMKGYNYFNVELKVKHAIK